jgi:geranylgeranyl diphosphate synthase type II
MIEYKTAVLVAAAEMGAIIAQTSKDNAKLIYDFGLNLGLAFQLQDDYLDAFGDPETFGKQVGGDIINKKDLFVLKSDGVLPSQAIELKQWFWNQQQMMRKCRCERNGGFRCYNPPGCF